MDKTLERKTWSKRRWIAVALVGITGLTLTWQVMSRAGGTRLSVDSARLTTAIVRNGEFHEYYPFDGVVTPATSVFLDVDEGGKVEEILVEGGAHVETGDLILRFSNATLQRTAIETEGHLLESLDIQRNTEFNRAQSSLLLKDTLLDLDYKILDLEKKYQRYETLMAGASPPLSRQEFDSMQDQLKYLKDKRGLLAERIRQEEILSRKQIVQAQASIERLNVSLDLLGRIVKSLEVRAPISGFLSTISAEVGQSIARGQRIGQIDLLDDFKVRVRIDQFYIGRVQVDTPGHVNLDGRSWSVKVEKVYPEVKNNAFEADVAFVQETPGSLKRGQTLTVELSFGEPTSSLTVTKGGFYQQTAGRWVYLVSPDGSRATRTTVRLGRQNPRQVEVLEGLREGDRIITSSYDAFNSVDELRFKTALKANKGNT